MPPYAKLYGDNPNPNHFHGNRILSIFTAPDGRYPISGMTLNLACYNQLQGYEGLKNALRILPKSDILSISMAWENDDEDIKNLLMEKAERIFVPLSKSSGTPYPSSYPFTITCANGYNLNADYSITPNTNWKGNSYAVPAIARLACYGTISQSENGIPVSEIFDPSEKPTEAAPASPASIITCPHCNRELRNRKTYAYLTEKPKRCPYCNRPM